MVRVHLVDLTELLVVPLRAVPQLLALGDVVREHEPDMLAVDDEVIRDTSSWIRSIHHASPSPALVSREAALAGRLPLDCRPS
ncbi:MAG: hypothetical protein H0T89_02405 [Deltaproteobacteria bacterium]|nr:hypothetical protein [Deltaproteobacteria bacterium]MDQ3296450.1 hypothetical protein [Myxococcota bacterium]